MVPTTVLVWTLVCSVLGRERATPKSPSIPRHSIVRRMLALKWEENQTLTKMSHTLKCMRENQTHTQHKCPTNELEYYYMGFQCLVSSCTVKFCAYLLYLLTSLCMIICWVWQWRYVSADDTSHATWTLTTGVRWVWSLRWASSEPFAIYG